MNRLIFVLALAAGCGGGGGSSTSDGFIISKATDLSAVVVDMATPDLAVESTCVIDLSVPPGDFTISNSDLSFDMKGIDMKGADMSPAKLGCRGYAACYAQCNQTAMSDADFTTCTNTCKSNTKTASEVKFSTAQFCSQNYCICGAGGDLDNNSLTCSTACGATTNYRCGVSADGTAFTEADGSAIPSNGIGSMCLSCLDDSSAKLFALPCSSVGAPDCNPSVCAVETYDCLTDLP